ncbi:MAG: hypothetical protein FP824_03335 [Euryarchaeota archaeon]|nr:hypothetical protein [Euryarchaeota archaeon]MBU4031373.1 hypothetical protein [Candidatus Thermoplasmatota archaeon]MBU4070555.1 hypothetical protein [Candidatus Thermoplasmatota archaeon]MBU4145105.1 hypothetical protein [Candidatus Thermoplasmatota archaeon]
MKNKCRKMSVILVSVVIMISALALIPASTRGANPHSYWFTDTISWSLDDLRIRDTTSDGTNPNGGVVRCWVEDTPAEVNTDVIPFGGWPYPGMSDIIGAQGQTGVDYCAMVQTAFSQTEPTFGENIIFVMELDKNVVTPPRVYMNNGAQIGTVPHGYIWAGTDIHDSFVGDQEVLPGTSPPTSFFEVLEMPVPTSLDGMTWTWAGVSGPSDVAGDTNGQIESWALMESVDDNGPWTQVGVSAFGSPISYATVDFDWYCAVPIWKGGIRSLVYSEPTQGWWHPPHVTVDYANVSPNPHNGNVVTEYVTLTASGSSLDMNPVTLEYSIDGSPWTTFTSPVALMFPSPYTEGLHSVDVRAFDGYEYSLVVPADFTITDTTAPLTAWGTVPGATAYVDSNLMFTAFYEDFTALDTDLANSYFSYRVNGGSWQNFTWEATFAGYGSYLYSLRYTIPAGTFSAGDLVEYSGQATDMAATPNSQVLGLAGPIMMVSPPPSYDIEIFMGWNLISFPVDAMGSPDIVLNDVGDDWSVVKWYDASTGRWKTYRPGSTVNDLTYVDYTMGLWVYITDPTDGMLSVIGDILTKPQIQLKAGWNLMGYPSLTPRTVADALWGTGAIRVEAFDPEPPYIIEVGPDYVMSPGNGYWVLVPADVIWTIDW